jgi:hypothetical protein
VSGSINGIPRNRTLPAVYVGAEAVEMDPNGRILIPKRLLLKTRHRKGLALFRCVTIPWKSGQKKLLSSKAGTGAIQNPDAGINDQNQNPE